MIFVYLCSAAMPDHIPHLGLQIVKISTPNNNNNKSIFASIVNLTYRRRITSIIYTDDDKLLQESKLTSRQPRKAPITLYIMSIIFIYP